MKPVEPAALVSAVANLAGRPSRHPPPVSGMAHSA